MLLVLKVSEVLHLGCMGIIKNKKGKLKNPSAEFTKSHLNVMGRIVTYYCINLLIEATKCTQDSISGSYEPVQVSIHNMAKTRSFIIFLPSYLSCRVRYPI
jgi:hypothetical protein